MENDKDLRVYTLPQRLLNSYPEKPSLEGWYTQVSEKSYYWDKSRGNLGAYQEGDFIIHFAGLTADEKTLSIQEHLRQPNICVLSYATRVSSAGGDLAFYAEKIFITSNPSIMYTQTLCNCRNQLTDNKQLDLFKQN